MKLDTIKQKIIQLNSVQCAQIKGGTDDSTASTTIIIEDVDVI